MVSTIGWADDVVAEKTVAFNIPQQRADTALTVFAEQADLTLVFPPDLVGEKLANELIGTYTQQEGADILLAGTGLSPTFSNRVVLSIAADEPSANEGDDMNVTKKSGVSAIVAAILSVGANAQDLPNTEEIEEILDNIIVTGSSIRGVIPESSPLQIFDAVDIRNSGALTTEQFIATLPQNNNTLSEVGGGSSSRAGNPDSTSSVDLRGLGVGSTLVLLNGRRMAPSSGGQTADISFIPIGAIERVEVLTDGASAVYGADAIGGVVNFILRDQQDAAETVLTFGGADGGSEQWRIDQSFGFNWADGNALIALSYMDRSSLDAGDRDFSQPAGVFTLIPDDTRKNVLATVAQRLPGDFTISADLLYSSREPRTANTLTQLGGADLQVREIEHEQTVFNMAIERSLGEKLNAALLITHADASSDTNGFNDGPNHGVGAFFESEDTKTLDITAKVDGEMVRFRSGALMFALGAGYTEEEFDQVRDFTVTDNFTSEVALDRDTKYAFAELLVPIAGPEQNITGLRRLEISVSARYTDYSDFGDDTVPKIGILWSPVEQLKIRGTFGESFKAPTLLQLAPANNFYFLYPTADSIFSFATDIWTPDNSAIVLFSSAGTKPGLGPERADSYTLGFDVDLSQLTFSATYFNIDYKDRVAVPDISGFAAFVSPQDFSEIYNLNPTLEQITEVLTGTGFNLTGIDTSDPAAVLAGITVWGDNRKQNVSLSEVDGLDLAIDYTTEMGAGEFRLGFNATKIFSFEDRIFASAPAITRADTVLYPADLKARTYLGFGKDRWNTRLNVNYVDEYDNPFDAANPTVDDWTTVDLLFSYEFPAEASGFSSGTRLSLTVQNAFDEDPPLLPNTAPFSLINPSGFDPANANPLGRFISLQISKTW